MGTLWRDEIIKVLKGTGHRAHIMRQLRHMGFLVS